MSPRSRLLAVLLTCGFPIAAGTGCARYDDTALPSAASSIASSKPPSANTPPGASATPADAAAGSPAPTGTRPAVAEAGPQRAAPEAAAAPAVPSPTGPLAVRLGDWDDVQKYVAAFPGRVVLVDVWNLNCAPCVKEFPHLVALQKTHGDRVACSSVDTDFYGAKNEPPESYVPTVTDFLRERQATGLHLVCRMQDEKLYEKLDLAGPPAVYVWDKTGKLRKRFDNEKDEYGPDGFTYEKHVAPFVKQLLEEQP
jgi:thiol-disulfide isomerase/thioredoxin